MSTARCYYGPMVVDFHTHIFPPQVSERREDYLGRDSAFAEMYSSPRARIATAEELLASMEEAEVDTSVILGFAWSEQELCREHNEYLLEAAARSGGRLIPFCVIQPRAGDDALAETERCVRAGARGLGELRPESQGYSLDQGAGDILAQAALGQDLVLLFHVSEPVGHSYPGKSGLGLDAFYQFVSCHQGLTVVGAHWAGGLPFYALMPEVREALANVYVDTAASPFLYSPAVYRQVAELVGAERILFGSDYPLIPQRRQRQAIEEGFSDDGVARQLVLGENARRLLRIDHEGKR
jgi:predicted TIM-barrel fold metal-dependent hydrolase